MTIKKVVIKNLHGYLSKNIELNDDINLIVGINGSGKTSLLNVINWLMTPSLADLCTNEFDELSVEFVYEKDVYKISCIQTDIEVIINLRNISTNKLYNQIQADIKIHPKNYQNRNIDFENLYEDYKRLSPERHEIETWNFLFNKIPNPIIIGLDRNLYTEEGNEVSYLEENGLIRKKINSISKISPVDKVIRLSGIEYSKYKNRILDLNKRLNDKIMLSSFDETITEDNIKELLSTPKINIKQVESLEIKVREYFKENLQNDRALVPSRKKANEDAFIKIEKYFSNLKLLINQFSKNKDSERYDILYITNLNQFKKIRELIKEFEDFEHKSKRFYESLKQYLDTINVFLKDSAKELYFDKYSSKLKFRILNQKGVTVKEGRDIKELSSGEMQILILFTFIKFNNKIGKLFIIDEPELSLHPRWQENFIDGIKNIMPSETQIIFATHSPAIVGGHKEYCKILMPY